LSSKYCRRNIHPELCCHWLFYIAAIEVFWLLPWTRRLLPSASRLWSGYSGSARLTWSASCLHRYMHFLLFLPLGLPVGHRRHKVLRFLTACYIACAGLAEHFGVLLWLFLLRSCLFAIINSHWSNMPVLAKVNPAM